MNDQPENRHSTPQNLPPEKAATAAGRVPEPSLRNDAANVLRGLAMGTADVIPGVSGGTVALILGIYQRLVTAISHVDGKFIGLVRQKKIAAAAGHIDLRFLVALGGGIGLGVVLLGRLMNDLLLNEETRGLTLAAFFGMIVASTWLVARYVRVKSSAEITLAVVLALAGAVFAFVVTGLPEGQQELTLGYVFFCGMLGICAMILPGISGAYILLILGAYLHLTGILKSLPHVSGEQAAIVAVFACGCGVGLLSFSKVLRWLLTHYQWQTMAVLCGFMIGALRKIWPFQVRDAEKTIDPHHPVFENIWPPAVDRTFWIYLAVAIVAGLVVLAVDWFTLGHEEEEEQSSGL